MTTKQTITLKVLGLGITILYFKSGLWSLLLRIYDRFNPVSEELQSDSFPIFVVFISIVFFGLVFFVLKGQTFWAVLFQDLGLMIISVPFFGTVSGFFEDDIYDVDSSLPAVYVLISILTIITINLNDWIKTRRPICQRGTT